MINVTVKEPMAIVKTCYYKITKDKTLAAILNHFLYWSEYYDFHDDIVAEDNEIKGTSIEPREGWIYKAANKLEKELMLCMGEKTVRRRLINLVEMGFLFERDSQHKVIKRRKEYRLNLPAIIKALNDNGYDVVDNKTNETYYSKDNLQKYFKSVGHHDGASVTMTDGVGHHDGCIYKNKDKKINKKDYNSLLSKDNNRIESNDSNQVNPPAEKKTKTNKSYQKPLPDQIYKLKTYILFLAIILYIYKENLDEHRSETILIISLNKIKNK